MSSLDVYGNEQKQGKLQIHSDKTFSNLHSKQTYGLSLVEQVSTHYECITQTVITYQEQQVINDLSN
jgi:hypothetical protein